MRFVDGEQCDVRVRQQIHEARRQQALGSHVKQIVFAVQQPLLDLCGCPAIERRIEERGSDTELRQRCDLIPASARSAAR